MLFVLAVPALSGAARAADTIDVVDIAGRDGFTDMSGVTDGRFHSIYHQLHHSPFRVVALQPIAKWLHPDEFPDLDPEAIFRSLHERFLPFDYEGVFWASLK